MFKISVRESEKKDGPTRSWKETGSGRRGIEGGSKPLHETFRSVQRGRRNASATAELR
jgi:hypothetical protein